MSFCGHFESLCSSFVSLWSHLCIFLVNVCIPLYSFVSLWGCLCMFAVILSLFVVVLCPKSFVSICVSLWSFCASAAWPLGPLGLCLLCPFSNRSMVGKYNQTKKGKFTILIFLISTLVRDILRRQALGFCLDHTSLAQQSSQCSLCRRCCDGAPPGHKFVSRWTTVPFAIWGMADPHKAWCLWASGLCHTGWRGSLHCHGIQHSSWTIRTHSFWSTQTTPPAPSQAHQMDGWHAKMVMDPSSPWIC